MTTDFTLSGYVEALTSGNIYNYWKEHDLPTTSCPHVTGIAVNAVLLCHKDIDSPNKLWLDRVKDSVLSVMKQEGVTLSGTDQRSITVPIPVVRFFHPGKNITFLVPLSTDADARIDLVDLHLHLKGDS